MSLLITKDEQIAILIRIFIITLRCKTTVLICENKELVVDCVVAVSFYCLFYINQKWVSPSLIDKWNKFDHDDAAATDFMLI